MGRGSESERLEQEAELFGRVVFGEAQDAEDLLLHLALMDTDRPAADLVTVAHEVVGPRQCFARGVGEPGQPFRVRGREGVMDGRPRLAARASSTNSNIGASMTHTKSQDPSGIRFWRSAISNRAAPSRERAWLTGPAAKKMQSPAGTRRQRKFRAFDR